MELYVVSQGIRAQILDAEGLLIILQVFAAAVDILSEISFAVLDGLAEVVQTLLSRMREFA